MQKYVEKRDFTRTPEPPPAPGEDQGGPLTFVIHKHAARRLHYDLRLELDSVLKSWAIPAGPSYDPKVKRLAVMVEDHPLSYGSFEGVIPEGEYGAGEVIIWDRGIYSPESQGKAYFEDRKTAEEFMRRDMANGKAALEFKGHKLQGRWEMVRMRDGKDWLMIKHQDNFADPNRDVVKEDRSVVSGLTIEDMKAGALPAADSPSSLNLQQIPGAKKTPFPGFMPPMLATLVEKPFSDPNWTFEPKLDGYRTLALIRNGNVKLVSRRGLDATEQYSHILPELKEQPVHQLILDGEVVVIDEKGKVCFQCLQDYLSNLRAAEVEHREIARPIYYIFDILYLDGYDLTGVTFRERRKLLEKTLLPGQYVKLIENFSGDGQIIYEAVVRHGMEGIIAKRGVSLYEPGKRSSNWLKIKAMLTDDFVVGGYTQGMGSRSHSFGALIVGRFNEKGELVYAGHVGGGFDDAAMEMMKRRLEALKTDKRPFTQKPPINAPTTWVRPELVVEVKFSEWTHEKYLRVPIFLRLRDDKAPVEVRDMENLPEAQNPEITDVQAILTQLGNHRDEINITVEGHEIALKHLDKELWPVTPEHRALTKRDLLVYLTQVSSYLLPHLKDRLLTLSRYPDGINGQHFWQKHWTQEPPAFVKEVKITTESEGIQEYMVCNNLATLLWLGQIADLELHVVFSRIVAAPDPPDPSTFPGYQDTPDINSRYPDFIIFDIDPYVYSGKEARGAEPELNRIAFQKTAEASLWVKEILDGLSLSAFVKTSGKTGVHIYVPIYRQFTFDETRAFARTVCEYVFQRHPQETTLEWAVEKRAGKIFLDYNQNSFAKTLASAYSPRPGPEAGVSMPLYWEELTKVYPADFNILTVPAKMAGRGDPWAKIMDNKHDLKKVLSEKRAG